MTDESWNRSYVAFADDIAIFEDSQNEVVETYPSWRENRIDHHREEKKNYIKTST